MNATSIRVRVLLLTLVPLLIISVILGYYLARSRIQDSEDGLRERGDALVRHLARESEFGLFSEDSRQLGELAATAANEDDVYQVTIRNIDKKILAQAHAGPEAAPPGDRLMRFTAPVYRSGVSITDNGEQFSEGDAPRHRYEPVIGWVEMTLSRSATLERQGQIVRNVVLLTLGSALLCILIALWMAKGIVQPIIRLSQAVDAVRKGGSGVRVEAGSGGELGALESGFNDMAEAMERAQSRLHAEVRSATNKLSLLLESLPVAVFRAEFGECMHVSYMTPSIGELTGFSADEFRSDGTLWIERTHPEDRARVLGEITRLREAGSCGFEYRWQVRDGGYRWFYGHVRLDAATDDLRLRMIGMWQDISAFKEISERLNSTIRVLQERNDELDASRQEALAASRNKATFLANMSHEIRTPLSSIIGYAEKMQSMLQDAGTPEEIRKCIRVISQASAQLRRIIDDILNFSKLESGAVRLDQIPFDLRADFEDVISMMSSGLDDRKVELSLLFDSGVPARLAGDPGRINQVLMNLLNNAIKFTPDGSIDVHVSAKNASVDQVELEISVSDTGIGMTQETIQRIFTPFHQGDASISRHYGGTGLGLSIVSRLIELWGGEIGVESEPGKGSRFWFTLTCRKYESGDDFVSDPRLRGRKVLLYDDHAPALRAMRNFLLAWSAEVYQARTRCQIKPMLDQATSAGRPHELVIIGAGVKDDLPGSLSLNVLLTLVLEDGGVPVLLIRSRQRPIYLECARDGKVVFMEKPIRRDVFYQNVCRLLEIDMQRDTDTLSSATTDMRGYAGIRVLLAEDNEFNRALITATLEARGLAVTQVQDGVQALRHAEQQDYDLVILDIHLPGMDGTEAARRIRALRPDYRNLPIIALTADIFFDTPDNLVHNGIDACLLKPLNEDSLWRMIDALLVHSAEPESDRPAVPTLRPGAGFGERPDLVAGTTVSPPPSFRRDMTRFLPALATSIGEMGVRLQDALQRDDIADLRSVLHELKGVVCYFAVAELSHAVLELEQLLRSGADPVDVRLSVDRLGYQIDSFVSSHDMELQEIDVSG